MLKVALDGKCMTTKESTHRYLKIGLGLPEYYGGNLDALWDILSTYSEPLKITLSNKDDLVGNLGGYGELLIELFQSLTKENANITFRIRPRQLFFVKVR